MYTFDGKRMRELREQAGVRRETFALAIDRSSLSVIAYESGRVDPPAVIVCAAADFLGCSPGDFFTDRVVPAVEVSRRRVEAGDAA